MRDPRSKRTPWTEEELDRFIDEFVVISAGTTKQEVRQIKQDIKDSLRAEDEELNERKW